MLLRQAARLYRRPASVTCQAADIRPLWRASNNPLSAVMAAAFLVKRNHTSGAWLSQLEKHRLLRKPSSMLNANAQQQENSDEWLNEALDMPSSATPTPSTDTPVENTNEHVRTELKRLIDECKAESAWRLFQQQQRNPNDDNILSNNDLFQLIRTIGEYSAPSDARNHRIQVICSLLLRRIPSDDPKKELDRLVDMLAHLKQFDQALAVIHNNDSSASTRSPESAFAASKLANLHPNTIAKLVDELIAGGRTEAAMNLYKQCRQAGYNSDSRLFSSFIRGFARLGDWESAKSFVTAKQQTGFSPSVADYVVVLRALFRGQQVQQAEEWYDRHVLEETMNGSVQSAAQIAITMISGYSKNEMPQKSREWFDTFRSLFRNSVTATSSNTPTTSESSPTPPSASDCDSRHLLAVWNAMLFSYASSELVDEATALYRQMQPAGVKPNIDTYNALILAFTRSQDIEMANSIFDHLDKWELRPTKYTYTMLIDACMKAGKMAEAVRWVDRMQSEECAPDTVLLTAMMDGYSRNRMYSHSLEIYDDMKRLGIPLDIVACTAILNGASRAGDYNSTLKIYNDIKEHGLKLTDYAYNALIRANGRLGNIQAAEEVFEKMLQSNIHPNIHTFNALISGYLRVGDTGKAYDIILELKTRELQPTVGTYAMLMELASTEGRCDNVLKYLNTLLKDESVDKIDDSMVAKVIDILGQHGHVEIIKMTFEALLAGAHQQPSAQRKSRNTKIEIRGMGWRKFAEVMIAHERPEYAKQAVINMIRSESKAKETWIDEFQMSRILLPFRRQSLWNELDEIFAALDTLPNDKFSE